MSHSPLLRCFLLASFSLGSSLLCTGSHAATSCGVLIVNTEVPGRPNADPARIEKALHGAGALRTTVVSWTRVDDRFMHQYHPVAVVLSGQGTPWPSYDQQELHRFCAVLRDVRTPMLGICGGHQLLALAFGGKVALIRRLRPGHGYDGCERERGWKPVTLSAPGRLFSALDRQPTVWLNHCDEVKILPPGFERTMSDGRGANQGMENRTRPIYGVQFHPEISDKQHSYGHRFLQRFLAVASINNPQPMR